MGELTEWRKEIDKINFQIIDLIKKRTKIVRKIGEYKKKKNIPIIDAGREEKIYQEIDKLAEEKGLNKEFVKKLFQQIIKQAKIDEK